VRILTTARGAMSADRTRSVNALNALVRSNDLGVDARKFLTASQIPEVSRWRPREEELSLTVTRTRPFAWLSTSSNWTSSSWPMRSS
jgi:transposase